MSPDRTRFTHVPLSTYRLQFNLNFTFRDATAIVPYLQELGVSDLYASPYLQARPGSLHGYDISNHNLLNPEIGTPEEHGALISALQEARMGHMLDIVPNHMGIGQPGNDWWMDVLENGQSSMYAPFFDIDWVPLRPELAGKVLLPVLGDQFGRVLERGEFKLCHEDGKFRIDYYENRFPVSPKSSALVLRAVLEKLDDSQEEEAIELESIVTALEHLPARDRTDPRSVAERRRENVVTRRRLAAVHDGSAAYREALGATLNDFNGSVGDPGSYDQMDRLLDDQAYRLSYWRVAAEEINYRRFFDINDLAGVRVERAEVFQSTHRLIFQLIAEGKVDALRVDHPDGLYDPFGYLRDLQQESARRAGGPMYVLAEKILTGDEHLPSDWQIAGTVGYEYLNRLNGLFVAGAAERAMDAVYTEFIGHRIRFAELVYEKKKLILRVNLVSELNVLAYLLDRLSEKNRRYRDFTLGALTDALRETTACFPVYRTYIDAHVGRVAESDRDHVLRAIRTAVRRNPTTSRTVFEFIRSVLLLDWPDDLDEEALEEHARFVMKFQQLTGPVMAKGMEDTAFYIYNRLISLNEVGGEPTRFGTTPKAYHEWVESRLSHWPKGMNATSTHDTKRSEDVRARINVLSEMPERWGEHVRRWSELNSHHRREEEGEAIPDANDEYLLYQTLVGAWPLETLDDEAHGALIGRLQGYMEKATREAKVHTSWINPNEGYDEALKEFVAAILARGGESEFLADFIPFQAGIARLGMLNALSQTLVKLASPGVPDVYQGQEIWDFSLVDPDNRRPVDFELRARMLAGLHARMPEGKEPDELAAELLAGWRDGRVKLFVISTMLRLRRELPELFLDGSYIPLAGEGDRAENLISFARQRGDDAVIVVAPRLWRGLIEGDAEIPDAGVWRGTRLAGGDVSLAGRYRNLLGGGEIEVEGIEGGIRVELAEILAGFPVAVLRRL